MHFKWDPEGTGTDARLIQFAHTVARAMRDREDGV